MLTAIEAIVDDIVSVVSIVVKLCSRFEFMRLFFEDLLFPRELLQHWQQHPLGGLGLR